MSKSAFDKINKIGEIGETIWNNTVAYRKIVIGTRVIHQYDCILPINTTVLILDNDVRKVHVDVLVLGQVLNINYDSIRFLC